VSIPRDPGQAPPRPDLTFLRHRGRPRRPAPPPPPVPVTERRPSPPAPTPPPALAPPAAAGSLLDLSPPAPAPPAATPALPAPVAAAAAAAGSSLDLSPSAAVPTGPQPSAPSVRHPVLLVRDARRAGAGAPTRLTAAEPTVTLTRVQSGTGALEIVLTRAAAAGDLSMGCVFQTADGTEAVVQAVGDVTTGPPGARLPLVRWKAQPDRETLHLDQRQVTRLRRALIYGVSPSVSVLTWQGALVITTFGGARIEVPIDHTPFSGTLALLTIYNVDGELVLRAEMGEHHGPPEMAAQAFDYHVPWIDGRRPLT
jgi:uncharacterized protein involved in tellurium resistance